MSGSLNCRDCGMLYADMGTDLMLPDQQWRVLAQDGATILCANCICKRAEALGATVITAWIDQLLAGVGGAGSVKHNQTLEIGKQFICNACKRRYLTALQEDGKIALYDITFMSDPVNIEAPEHLCMEFLRPPRHDGT